MINNHILYLLLCLFILIEANLINDKENVYVLRLIEQIRVYMSKILRNFKNRILVLNEIKSVSKNIINTLKNILLQNNYISQELYYYINNINKVDVLRLFKILEEIKNKNDLEYDMIHINNIENNINNNKNSLYNVSYDNKNNFSKRNYYKQLNKENEIKKNKIGNELYIKKSIPNKQLNNNEVTNKIFNIIINDNNTNVNYDNQNKSHFSINYYNINKNNKIYNNNNNYSSNNFALELNNYNDIINSITIKLNNIENNSKINILPQSKKIYNINCMKNLGKFSCNINNIKFNLKNNNDFNYIYNYDNNNDNNNHLLNPQQKNNVNPEPPFLPPKRNKSEFSQKKYTLILDLDEKLVRYWINEKNQDEAKIIFRPGLFYFLNKVYPLFDIVILTVATKEYADPIIDIIEENKKYFIARLFREHATIKNHSYVKDLTNLGRDINTIIIIDDKESSFSFQKQNGILIKPFFGTYLELKNDFILYDLFKILTKILLGKNKDVRYGINKYQYEIKRKITKKSNKNNFYNYVWENKYFYYNSIFINRNRINNNINYNKVINNSSLKIILLSLRKLIIIIKLIDALVCLVLGFNKIVKN